MVGLTGSLVACGGGSAQPTSTTATEIFKPKSPLASGLYFQFRGPPAIVRNELDLLGHDRQLGGVTVIPRVHGPQDCMYVETIRKDPKAAPRLRKYVGQKLTVWVFGRNRFAPTICRALAKVPGVG